jgi:hypothetical protein
MSAKHTPGPWWHDPDAEGFHPFVIRASDGDDVPWLIAGIAGGVGVIDEASDVDHAEANARLIAAAPELWGELRWYADYFCEGGIHSELCGRIEDDDCAGCRARRAITKAEDEA